MENGILSREHSARIRMNEKFGVLLVFVSSFAIGLLVATAFGFYLIAHKGVLYAQTQLFVAFLVFIGLSFGCLAVMFAMEFLARP